MTISRSRATASPSKASCVCRCASISPSLDCLKRLREIIEETPKSGALNAAKQPLYVNRWREPRTEGTLHRSQSISCSGPVDFRELGGPLGVGIRHYSLNREVILSGFDERVVAARRGLVDFRTGVLNERVAVLRIVPTSGVTQTDRAPFGLSTVQEAPVS